MYWTYFFELGAFQVFAAIIMSGKFDVDGRIGALTGVIFSGPLTYLSYYLDEKYQFVDVRLFGIIGLIIGVCSIVIYLIAERNE